MMTYDEALVWAISELKDIETASLDASLLLEFVTGADRVTQIVKSETLLTEAENAQFRSLVTRRKNHEPLAYIIGEKEFWGLPFYVEPGVLIPRPDTETLIATVLALVGPSDLEFNLLELGVGSGAIICSLLKEYPNAQGFAVDMSDTALDVAQKNAQRLGVDDRLNLLKSNWADKINGQANVVVSNPPYIRPDVIEELEPTVKDYEPITALDGGADGLECYRDLLDSLRTKITPGGLILLEIGYDQGKTVPSLMQKDYEQIRVYKDLAGQDRVVVGLRKKEQG